MNVGSGARILARAAVVAVIATATGACSTLESLDPFGDDTPGDTAAAPDQSADNSATPDLSSVPDRPMQTSTPDSQRQVAQSLAADRSQATYSADTLRGDSVAAAPPPPPPSAVDTASLAAPMPSTTTTSTTTTTTMAAAPPPPAPSTDGSDDVPGGTVSVPGTQTADTTPTPPPPAAAPVPAPASAPAATTMASNSYTPTYSAPVAGPGDGRPAVPPGPVAGVPGAQAPVMSDAQLGFQPSRAPALDASVSQFVAPSILNRYRQTSGGRAYASNSAVTTTAVPVSRRSRAMGGPDEMTGAVVANLDSLSGSPVSTSPSVYAGANGTPSSVVFFPGDTTVLNAAAKAQVRAAAASFRASGGTGFIRVVGHASSRTGNMPLERHLVVIFEKSQQRANSVAQELIRAGVPADKVLVEAVGDSQPVYYESMPKGEDGNRRAEIFVQS